MRYNRNMSTNEILRELNRLYPDAKPALQFKTPYELLVAVILSAIRPKKW